MNIWVEVKKGKVSKRVSPRVVGKGRAHFGHSSPVGKGSFT